MKAASTTIIVAIAASAASSLNAFVAPSCRTQHDDVQPFSSVMFMSGRATIESAFVADAPATAAEDKSFDEFSFLYNDIGEELRQQQTDIKLPSDYYTKEDDILASLFGSNEIRNDFFRNTYGHRVAYFPRNLCTNNQQHQKHQHQLLKPPIMSGCFDLQSLYNTNDWIQLRKRGSTDILDRNQTTYNDLTEYISGGGSATIPIIPGDYLYDTKVQIEHALGVIEEWGTSMNIYHSGPSAVALNLHYDAYPVLVLHLEGKKEWMIQNNNLGCLKAKDVTEWRNVTMTAGDLLYIPKGVFHAATGDRVHGSTHATIGLPADLNIPQSKGCSE